MKFANRWLLWAALLYAPLLQAQYLEPNVWFTASIGSLHAKNASQYNQDNWGIGIEWVMVNPYIQHTRLVAGRFLNSERHYSTYAGVMATPITLYESQANVHLGLVLGTINGYPRAWQGRYFPLAAPVVEIIYGRLGANLYVIPPVKSIPTTLALQLKFGF